MKKLIPLLAVSLGLLSTPSIAQENDTLRIVVNGTNITIATDDLTALEDLNLNGMLQKFSTGMQAAAEELQSTMAEIKRQEEAGEITPEEAEEQRDEAAEVFEDKAEELAEMMEDWGEAMEDQEAEVWEKHEDEWEEYAERWEEEAERMENGDSPYPISPPMPPNTTRGQQIIIDEDGIKIIDSIEEEIIIKGDEERYTTSEGIIGFHFGWNTMYNEDFQLSAGDAEVRFFDSWAYDLEFGHKVRLGSTSPFLFYYGLNFSWHNIETKESLVKFEDADGNPAVGFQSRTDISNVTETEFDIVYMDIPLMFLLDLSGDDFDDGFTLGLGGYGGVRLGSERETEYNDFNNDQIEEDIDDHFLSNQWRYGLMGQIGWGAIKITAKYDLNPLFQSNLDTPNYNMASLTVGFVF